jgi:hypothetical protein
MMNKYLLLGLSFFLLGKALANNPVTIMSPLGGEDLTSSRSLQVTFRLNNPQGLLGHMVVTRKAKGVNVVMNRRHMDYSRGGVFRLDVTPPKYFCESDYTASIYDGLNNLIRSVIFKAGVGACESNDVNKFINLEENLSDLEIFLPSNQGDRDTCGAFASAAALEAAYKRLKNVRVQLSQNYIHHIVKSSWLTPTPHFLYENQSSFFGGNSTFDALQFLSKYRIPELQFSTYQNQQELSTILSNLGIPNLIWSSNPVNNRITQDQIDALEYSPSHISLAARLNARYGISKFSYQSKAPKAAIAEIEEFLKNKKEVIFSINLRWMDKADSPKTKIYSANVNNGAHLMLIVGYDKTNANDPYFLVKNSWADGIIRVHYDVLRNQNSISYGTIDEVTELFWPNPDRWIGKWEMKHDRWRGELKIRRISEANIEGRSREYRLGEYLHQNGKRHCVYGGFTNGSTRLLMKIDFNSEIQDRNYNVRFSANNPPVNVVAKDVCPPTPSGQSFVIDLPLNNNTQGQGTTEWNNRSFPVQIWR